MSVTSLADKLGIRSFVNHPLGIWDAPSHLAYGRKAVGERIDGDAYILTVTPVSAAELLGEQAAQLSTDIYVNRDANAVKTLVASNGAPEFAAKYMEKDGTIHPSVVLKTDLRGYKKDHFLEGEDDDQQQLEAHRLGEFDFMTPEDILSGRQSNGFDIAGPWQILKFP